MTVEAAVVLERLSQSKVPGAAIAVVRDGELAWSSGYGVRAAGQSQPVDVETVFGAASVSKAMAALAVFGLAEEGRIDLDADVRPLLALPLEAHPILGIGSDQLGPITARSLLLHRSGVVGRGTTPNTRGDGFLDPGVGGGSRRLRQNPDGSPPAVPTLAASWMGLDGGRPVQLTYVPESRKSYSGAGYLVLQHIVEQITGETFAAHLHHVLSSYGATRATFDLMPQFDNFASGHDSNGVPLPGGHEIVPWSAAGGLYSDVLSLAAVLAAVVRDDDTPMGSSFFGDFRAGAGTVAGVHPFAGSTFTRGGDNGGYRAMMVGYPEVDAGVVVLTNGRGTDGPRLRIDLAKLALFG